MISHRISRGLALVALAFAGSAGAQAGYGYGQGYNTHSDRVVVRCESQDERTRHCAADIRGNVRLVNQMSRSQCIEGRTWGYDRQGIWVGAGCRADFEIDNRSAYGYDDRYDRNRRDYGQGRVIRCESVNSRTVYCDADTRYGARLLSQASRSACIEGRTWGWNTRGVWVANGCRGQFQLGGRGNDDRYGYGTHDRYPYDDRYGNNDHYGNNDPYGYNNTGRRLTCQSQDSRYNFCRVSGYIRQAQIQRQLSSSQCQYNYSWGYRSDGIWVDRGCRAEFVVY